MHFYRTSSHNSSLKPYYTLRILRRKFAMMATAYKWITGYRHQCGTLCSLWKCSLVIIKAII